ncbi:Uncharacterised protein [Mycobacteroides abscessus subsp. massiliense]|nr:Uncharacterised protein [Mycobacteroides abscessus subsp. massiliense]
MTEKTSYTQDISGLWDTSGTMPLASNSVNFSMPIHAMTIASP